MTKLTGPAMLQRIDPFVELGTWLVGSESGAMHSFTSDEAGVRVVRVVVDGVPHVDAVLRAHLRRDGREIRVLAATHLDVNGERASGVEVGSDMWLTLEPLDADAVVTVRRTTPVVWIAPPTSPTPAIEGSRRRSSPVRAVGSDRRAWGEVSDGPSGPVESRMVAAGEIWLVWCVVNGVNPLAATVSDLERAAVEMKVDGADEQTVLDLLDQVGFMTGLWREPAWLQLRRTI